MYTVTRTTPDGTTKTFIAPKIRDAGKHVAYVLYLNAGISKKEATRHGMAAERDHQLSAHGYTFTVTKEV